MTSDSERNEGSRKTLDEIRREIDAEYALIDADAVASDVREVVDASHEGDPPTEDVREAVDADRRRAHQARSPEARNQPPRMIQMLDDDGDIEAERLEQFFERHERAMGRRPAADERRRWPGYALAALLGCVAGQVMLLAFFIVVPPGLFAELVRAKLVVTPGVEATAPAPPPVKEEPPPVKEEPAQSVASTPVDAPATSDTPAPSSGPTDLPDAAQSPSAAADLPVGGSPETSASSRASDLPVAAVTPRSRRAVKDASDLTETRARLRSAVNEWLRTSSRGGTTTEPVIVLAPDARTAKTYVSVSSPIGLIPREQRWELGARGWMLVDDRQVGLPVPAQTPRGR